MSYQKKEIRFARAETLDHAVELMAENGATAIAGGTDLIVKWRDESKKPDYIVDINSLPELKEISVTENRVKIGSLVTFTMLAEHRELEKLIPILSKAALSVGSPQIRNRGTIGGNIANASPAADLSPVLSLFDAELLLISKEGRRSITIDQFLTGTETTSLRDGELIEAFFLEIPPASGMHFEKFGRRNAQAIARLNGACRLRWSRDKTKIDDLRLVVGSATPVPLRIPEAEELLIGVEPTLDLFDAVGEKAWSRVEAITGVRESRNYKMPAVRRLVSELLVGAYGTEEE